MLSRFKNDLNRLRCSIKICVSVRGIIQHLNLQQHTQRAAAVADHITFQIAFHSQVAAYNLNTICQAAIL